MYVCIYVCMHTCVHACMYIHACTHVCIHVRHAGKDIDAHIEGVIGEVQVAVQFFHKGDAVRLCDQVLNMCSRTCIRFAIACMHDIVHARCIRTHKHTRRVCVCVCVMPVETLQTCTVSAPRKTEMTMTLIP